MSSVYVRNQVKAFIASDIPSETLTVDITAQYKTMTDFLSDNSITYEDPWLGIQFISDVEEPITVTVANDAGRYREFGIVFLHVVEPTKDGVGDAILARSETIRDAFRGVRINDIVIEGAYPPNFESGATLELENGFTSATITIPYYRDLNL